MRAPCTAFFLLAVAATALPSDRVSLAGKVVDPTGKPVAGAAVLIYHAGVKKGYSTFCPSCYSDCGKRAVSGRDGSFAIGDLQSDLVFQLVVAKGGFEPALTGKFDPASGQVSVLLRPRVARSDASLVRGRVISDHGRPLRDTLIEPEGIEMNEFPDGRPSPEPLSIYGEIKGLEPLAVTDQNGGFELLSERYASGFLLRLEARGFAQKYQALSTGLDRQSIVVSPGAVIRGRLMDHGQPVANAEIGLIPRKRGGFGNHLKVYGDPFTEMRVGTKPDGSFVLADVPAPVDWYLYAKMESIAQRGATPLVECSTKRGGEVVDMGDISLQPGYRLKGKLTLSDRTRIPEEMRIILTADPGWDSQIAQIQSDGTFEFSGVPTGSYRIAPSVRGYQLGPQESIISVNRDVDDLNLTLVPDHQRNRE